MLERIQQRFTRGEYAAIERGVFSGGQVPPALSEALAPCDSTG
jgi:hypothetical protein